MNFPHFAVFRIDEADLCGKDKGDVLSGKGKRFEIAILRGNDVLQAEEAVSCGLQFLFEKKEPFGMSEVSSSEKLNSFYLGPVGESIEDHFAGGSPREL